MRSQELRGTMLCLSICFVPAGCSRSDGDATQTSPANPSAGTEPLSVYVSSYPLQYFAERIGGRHVTVRFPAPPDQDPAFWMPGVATIGQYQQAEVILLNGAGYERWVAAVSLPAAKLCDTSAAFAKDHLVLPEAVTHSHGPTGQHAHGGTAFTTWLDPTLAVQQAEAIRAALTQRRPQHAEAFQQNFTALQHDLESLDRDLAAAVASARDVPVVFSHPVYQYLQRRYGLNGKSVHWEPQEPPTPDQWIELQQLLAQHPARWMIWEAAPVEQTVAKLAAAGLQCVVFDPCGNAPGAGDYLKIQRRNISAVSPIFVTGVGK